MAVPRAVVESVVRGGVSVYVHWPYCSKLCSYCNFTKYRQPPRVDQQRMRECLVTEANTLLEESVCAGVESVYFGGGTPSLAPPTTIARVLEAIGDRLSRDAEVTLEVNPSSSVLPKLHEFKAAGINRVSIGVQSFDDHQLAALNRDHSAAEAGAVLMEARTLFPGKVNSDLIFGLPGQTFEKWMEDLETLLRLADSHCSLYQLTVEKGTPLAKAVKGGDITLPSEEAMADMYELAVERMKREGLERYEVSNFARPGSESRHNLFYWFGGSYLGIGTGAHSRLKTNKTHEGDSYVRAVNILTPELWMEEVEKTGDGRMVRRAMSERERFEEVVATSLRTSTGLHERVCQMYGVEMSELVSAVKNHCPEYWSGGLLERTEDGFRATGKGLSLLDSILSRVLECVSAVPCSRIE